MLLQLTVIILRFFFGGMSYGLLDLADLEHSDDLTEKCLVCWLVFELPVLIDEIFPQNYNVYRNDRGTVGGRVFVLVEKSLTSVEQTQFIADGELEWVKIKLLKNKDLLVGFFYMPHREHQHLDQLKRSLRL
jgi:hypothetical protein